MEYASQYSIPRAVIYDESTDTLNPKYDLNRQLINEAPEITIINATDCSAELKKLLSQISNAGLDSFQSDLF